MPGYESSVQKAIKEWMREDDKFAEDIVKMVANGPNILVNNENKGDWYQVNKVLHTKVFKQYR